MRRALKQNPQALNVARIWASPLPQVRGGHGAYDRPSVLIAAQQQGHARPHDRVLGALYHDPLEDDQVHSKVARRRAPRAVEASAALCGGVVVFKSEGAGAR